MFTATSNLHAVDLLPPGTLPQEPELNQPQPHLCSARLLRFIMRLTLVLAGVGAYLLIPSAPNVYAAGPDNSNQVSHYSPGDTTSKDVLVVLVKYVVDTSPLADKLDIIRQARPVAVSTGRPVLANPPAIPVQAAADIFIANTAPQAADPAIIFTRSEDSAQPETVELPLPVPQPDAAERWLTVAQPKVQPETVVQAEVIQPETVVQPEVIELSASVSIAADQPLTAEVDLPNLPLTPETGLKHIILISIDGLRPDALDLANTPTLDNMINQGAYCPHAQTVDPSRTLPGHASMLSGMVPDKHGIHWNEPYIGWPGMTGPTVFNILHDVGLTSAMVYGKEKLNYVVLPNGANTVFGADVHDPTIRDEAIKVIEAGLPNLLFVHFPDTDRVGHDYGWMSENQLYAVNYVDGLIGELVSMVENKGYSHNTLWIVTADHGGHGFDHGDDSPFDRTIPWLATGYGVPAGIILSGELNIYDTAATILYAFDVPIPEVWDGKPVLGIFQ